MIVRSKNFLVKNISPGRVSSAVDRMPELAEDECRVLGETKGVRRRPAFPATVVLRHRHALLAVAPQYHGGAKDQTAVRRIAAGPDLAFGSRRRREAVSGVPRRNDDRGARTN